MNFPITKQTLVTLPEELHKILKSYASENSMTIPNTIVTILAEKLIKEK